MKKLRSLAFMLLLLLALAGCSSVPEADLSRLPTVEGIDFAAEIDTFVEDAFNVHTLAPGKTDKAEGYIWVNGGSGDCYSSDDSVVTVTQNGTVTAVESGTAYVLVRSTTGIYRITKYEVKGGLFALIPKGYLGIVIFTGTFFLIVATVMLWIVLTAVRRKRAYSASPSHSRQQAPAQSPASEEAYGIGGEENVWHNLKSLPDLGKYDIYRNVNIQGQANTSHVDAIVVCENGVYLLEVKSLRGDQMPDGTRMVRYNHLREDPSNQVMRHRFAFINLFPELRLNDPIYSDILHDVLVFSYPHKEVRCQVDTASFPSSPYAITVVDQLLNFLCSANGSGIYGTMMGAMSEKLKACSAEWIVSGIHGQGSRPDL